MQKLSLEDKLQKINEHWRPKIVGQFNGQDIKLVKFRGRFVWHVHEDADEMFLPLHGTMRVEFRDHAVDVGPGELLIVPRGVEHRTMSEYEVSALLIHPTATRNTGNIVDENLTSPGDEWV